MFRLVLKDVDGLESRSVYTLEVCIGNVQPVQAK
jgi:hypothetical protein